MIVLTHVAELLSQFQAPSCGVTGGRTRHTIGLHLGLEQVLVGVACTLGAELLQDLLVL